MALSSYAARLSATMIPPSLVAWAMLAATLEQSFCLYFGKVMTGVPDQRTLQAELVSPHHATDGNQETYSALVVCPPTSMESKKRSAILPLAM